MPNEELQWLNQNPKLEELMERYPTLWEDAAREISAAAQSGRALDIRSTLERSKAAAEMWSTKILKSHSSPHVLKTALPHIVKSRMLHLALDRCYLAARVGRVTGKVRFNLWNGLIVQKLFFERDLIPKLISMKQFRFWWRIVRQKALFQPLVKDRGLYCFYSRELINALAEMIADRTCLEIGAGNGRLSHFLNEYGVPTWATDDYSWSQSIEYPEQVEKLSAKQALIKYKPKVVICSWPPPDNRFERYVFQTKSVELYIAIVSSNKFISGNWDAYKNQDNFEFAKNSELTSYVLPPEFGSSVYIFRRKDGNSQA